MPQTISDDQLNQLIATDPQIQQIIAGVWGTTPVNQRPGDTPKNLEQKNDAASKQIASVLQSRGIQLPSHTFINPRSAAVEHMHGWAGLPTAAKVAIIGGAALATGGALGAFGGLGAAGGAGGAGSAAVPSIGASSGLAAGAFPTIAGTAGAGGLLASTPIIGSAALPFAGGAGNLAGGTVAGSSGGFLRSLKNLFLPKGSNPLDLAGKVGSVIGKTQQGKAEGANQQAQTQQGQDRNAISLYQAQQQAQQQQALTDLERQKFGASEQGRNAKNAIMSALLGGGIPRTSINVPGIQSASVSGGLLDALKNNPDALKSLSMLKGQANTSLETGPSFTGGAMVTPPSLTPLPDTTGGGNSFLNTIAQIGQIAGAANPYYKKPTVQPDGGG
jgi:hypothetical protein